MNLDGIGLLAPTDRRGRLQRPLKVQFAQIELENRRAIFDRGADKGVLVYCRDNRLKLHLHGDSHPTPLRPHRRATGYTAERIAARCDHGHVASPIGQEQDRRPAGRTSHGRRRRAGFPSRGSRSMGGRASRTALAKTSCVKGGTHPIVARQSIPEYWLSIYRNEYDEEFLHFIRRSCLPPGHEGATGIQLRKRRTRPKLPTI